jgi:hypothetical protein
VSTKLLYEDTRLSRAFKSLCSVDKAFFLAEITRFWYEAWLISAFDAMPQKTTTKAAIEVATTMELFAFDISALLVNDAVLAILLFPLE